MTEVIRTLAGTELQPHKLQIAGEDVRALIGKTIQGDWSYEENVFQLLSGGQPNSKQAELVRVLLIALSACSGSREDLAMVRLCASTGATFIESIRPAIWGYDYLHPFAEERKDRYQAEAYSTDIDVAGYSKQLAQCLTELMSHLSPQKYSRSAYTAYKLELARLDNICVDVLACLQIPLQLLPALKIVARLPLLGKAYVEERSQWPNRYAGLNMEVASVGNDYDTITQALSRLQCTGSFVDMVTDVMISKQTSGKERCLVQAAFIAGTEYGSSAASSTAMRLLTMRGAGFVEAFQGVLSTFGFYHLGALPECAMMLWRMQHSDLPLEIQINDELKNSAWGTGKAVKFARRIPGFGHRFFKDDPRARELLTVCNKIISGPYIDLITELDDVLGRRNIGRLNMDGIGAAMGLHFGFSPCITPALSLISRTLGVAKLFQATEVTVEDCSLSFRSPKMR